MYRIVDIKTLPIVDAVTDDKVLTTTDTFTTVNVTPVDKTYRAISYLSSAINTVNSAYDQLAAFENMIELNYFTTDLTATYITANTLIHDDDISNVLAVGAQGGFLSKKAAASMQAECFALIQQLKERVMNMFTANLDTVFKYQQSMTATPVGGIISPTGTADIKPNITNNAEQYTAEPAGVSAFDFIEGQFSLKHLLTGFDTLKINKDFWSEFTVDSNFDFSHFVDDLTAADDDITYDNALDKIKALIDAMSDTSEYGFCNSNADDANSAAVTVPSAAIDIYEHKTIPAATIIFESLKRQIYVVIKNIYVQYLVNMTRHPNPSI